MESVTVQNIMDAADEMRANGFTPGRIAVSTEGWEELREDMIDRGLADIGEPSEMGFRLFGVLVVWVP